MKIFKVNSHGGIDVFNENQKLLIHLSNDDLKTISNIRQKDFDIETVMDRIPEWVDEQIELDNYSFADFNSHLYSSDEISSHEISARILADKKLIKKIAEDYQEHFDDAESRESDPNFSIYLDSAIASSVSIEDVMGEILCEKHPKELLIGKWRVAVVEKGDLHGAYRAMYYENDKPIVEFYDMSQDKEYFPNGQFTGGQYFLETLLTTDIYSSSITDMAKAKVGLSLYADVPSWTVEPGDLAVIGTWLQAVQKNFDSAVKNVSRTIEEKLTEANERSKGQIGKNDNTKVNIDIN